MFQVKRFTLIVILHYRCTLTQTLNEPDLENCNTDYTITIKKLNDKNYFGQCNEAPGTIVECSSIEEVIAEMMEIILEIIEANKLLERMHKNKSIPQKKE